MEHAPGSADLTVTKGKAFREGLRDGFPIGLGYLAVAFSLGITARNAGFSPFQGFLMSILVSASAGEYAAITVVAADGSYLQMALVILIANARYLLMSSALSQRFSQKTAAIHRFLVAFGVTDEIFAVTVARPGSLEPVYSYGAILIAVPLWAIGTALGIIAGNLLPAQIVSAFSVALYGMFLAVIFPAAKKDRHVAGLIAVCFIVSFACSRLPGISALSSGTKTIILTVVLSGLAAVLFPRKQEEESEDGNEA